MRERGTPLLLSDVSKEPLPTPDPDMFAAMVRKLAASFKDWEYRLWFECYVNLQTVDVDAGSSTLWVQGSKYAKAFQSGFTRKFSEVTQGDVHYREMAKPTTRQAKRTKTDPGESSTGRQVVQGTLSESFMVRVINGTVEEQEARTPWNVPRPAGGRTLWVKPQRA